MTDQASQYNTPDFKIKLPEADRLGETIPVRVGAMAPEFEARDLDEKVLCLKDLRAKGHVVLMMGSITSPMCAIAIPGMNRMHAELSAKGVGIYLVYVKESHPGENFPHHTSFEQKVRHARELQRLEGIKFPIIVDSLEGTIHRSYGPWPTSVFVIHRDGRLFFRSTITDTREVAQFLNDLLESDRITVNPDRVPHLSYSERLIEHDPDQEIHRRVYSRAGQKAFEDFWNLFPALRRRWP
ncbi:MAG TPA: redoxin domain-containing protein [Candidatus Binatia bacterium]